MKAQPSLALVLCLAACQAGQADRDPCASRASDREACFGELAATADGQMQEYFAMAMDQAAAPAELQAAQVAWEGYVNLHCHAIHENADGDVAGSFARCRWQLSHARTNELWRSYLQANGDVPEPVD